MKFKKVFFVSCLLWGTIPNGWAQQKIPMDFSVFDGWKAIERTQMSHNGALVSYEINPQEGDGNLYLYDASRKTPLMSVARGKQAALVSDGSFAAFRIVPPTEMVRKMKLEKVKKEKMPKDSIGIFYSGNIKKFAAIKSFSVPSEAGNWLAIHFEAEKSDKMDTAKVKKKFKSEGTPLVFYRPQTGDSLRVEEVTGYVVAPQGTAAYMIQSTGDSTEHSVLLRFTPSLFKVDTLMKQAGKMTNLVGSKQGDRCAFLFSTDTVKHKAYDLFLFHNQAGAPKKILPVSNEVFPQPWCASEKGKNWFSDNGSRLFFGVAPKPEAEPKDTLTEDEKVHLDLWSWMDADIQPRQKAKLKEDQERTWLAWYDMVSNKIVPLADDSIRRVQPIQRGDASFALGYNDLPYRRQADYMGEYASDLYWVDLNNGHKKLLVKQQEQSALLSPSGRHLVYFSTQDSTWHSLNTTTLVDVALVTPSGFPFYDEMNDMPGFPEPYGVTGFSEDGRWAYIYDRFDVWQFDLNQSKKPVNLTGGRDQKLRYRYLKLDDEEKGINLKRVNYFSLFNEESKQSGMAKLEKGRLYPLFVGDYATLEPLKAKNTDRFVVRRSTFRQYPELELTNGAFQQFTTITQTNPQQENYLWGDIRRVSWTTPMGKKLEGLLVTPEDLDPTKKYPMLVYFYERSSENLHQHVTPRPSRSIIHWGFCASNGYVVFIPDITYSTGDPGASAYDAIVSGTQSMVDQFSFIDSTRMALQGQSWGGYQIAWLITRTNMFRCAMAGAPVSNMTSAYGGIRWQTGMSRIFQYERTQSRIGSTLWDNLDKYIENSPVFFAPNVQTPLLMMHNDNDGAVPWYQGIEYFMALRRLNKPVWMLVYNNEEHNLLRRANTKDLTIRMMQFFDYYLKDAPMPVWMRDGIPAVDKGRKSGYDLIK